jgi:hypothetical protein
LLFVPETVLQLTCHQFEKKFFNFTVDCLVLFLDIYIIKAIYKIKYSQGISAEFLSSQNNYIITNVIGLLVINIGDIVVQILNLTNLETDQVESIIEQCINMAFAIILMVSSIMAFIIDFRIKNEKLNFELEELMYV